MPKTFDPLEFLAFARELANRSQTEVSLRTAIGRAYYAVFLIVRDKARIQGKDRLHDQATNAIRFKLPSAASYFEELKQLRIEADYFLAPSDLAYEDWLANWKLADHCASYLVEFLKTW